MGTGSEPPQTPNLRKNAAGSVPVPFFHAEVCDEYNQSAPVHFGHVGHAEGVERAIRFAFENLKPTDVILLGMWQKYKDQVAENVGYARKALGVA